MDIHYEKELIINNRELKYKGIFRVDELFSTINKAVVGRGYEKREKKTEELVTEQGRKTHLELRPMKIKTKYVTLMIKIKLTLDNVTETIEKIDEIKKKFQQGDINIVFDSWVLSDYRGRMGMRPFNFFMKGLINKVFYQMPLERGFKDELVGDTAYIYGQIKNHLRSYSDKKGNHIKDEDVRKEVAREMEKESAEDFSS
ncbi:MAG: hypothetical protein KJ597_02670 [Nanoarchaeota archaeon]|nr:hypothetical protein [Nanoarchaeota archaeon]